MGDLTKRGRKAVRRAYDAVETKILVHEGRKAVKAKAETTKRVTKKAIKAGLLAGAMAAIGVVVGEVRKRRER